MVRDVMQDTKSRMANAVTVLKQELGGFRTGRASPQLVERMMVEMYGVEMPLNQMAVISVPEPAQLAIRPYDANSISAIEKAIMVSDLGIMPNSDGKIIRLNLPRLTEERRRELTRLVGKRVEDAKVAVRNVRRDAQETLRDMKDESMLPEDDFHRAMKELQDLTDKYTDQIDQHGSDKEKEIMEV